MLYVNVPSGGLFWLKPVVMVLFMLRFQSSSSSCHQTYRFSCSVHLYHISLNFIRSSNVHGCVK